VIQNYNIYWLGVKKNVNESTPKLIADAIVVYYILKAHTSKESINGLFSLINASEFSTSKL